MIISPEQALIDFLLYAMAFFAVVTVCYFIVFLISKLTSKGEKVSPVKQESSTSCAAPSIPFSGNPFPAGSGLKDSNFVGPYISNC